MPTLYLVHTLLFLLLMALLVFLGTEVLEARHLLLRGAIFLVVGIFAIASCFLGFLRGGVSARLRRLYAGVCFLFLLSMIAVQVSRAIALYPEMLRVQRATEWFMPKTNRFAWWEGIRGPMHDFEYLVATIVILVIVLIGFALALRKSRAGGTSPSP